jgi:hypothetical protein
MDTNKNTLVAIHANTPISAFRGMMVWCSERDIKTNITWPTSYRDNGSIIFEFESYQTAFIFVLTWVPYAKVAEN